MVFAVLNLGAFMHGKLCGVFGYVFQALILVLFGSTGFNVYVWLGFEFVCV